MNMESQDSTSQVTDNHMTNTHEILERAKEERKANDKPWLWKKGQSANPKGRPKGKTMKEWAKDYLSRMTDEERDEFMAGIPKEVVWKMSEGNPETKIDAKVQSESFSPEEIALAKQILNGGNTRNSQSNQVTEEGSGGATS